MRRLSPAPERASTTALFVFIALRHVQEACKEETEETADSCNSSDFFFLWCSRVFPFNLCFKSCRGWCFCCKGKLEPNEKSNNDWKATSIQTKTVRLIILCSFLRREEYRKSARTYLETWCRPPLNYYVNPAATRSFFSYHLILLCEQLKSLSSKKDLTDRAKEEFRAQLLAPFAPQFLWGSFIMESDPR